MFSDASQAAPELAGGATLPFGYEEGLGRSVESVLELGWKGRVAPQKVVDES